MTSTVDESQAAEGPAIASPGGGTPFFERSRFVLAAYLLVGVTVLVAALLTVHDRTIEELKSQPGSKRSRIVLSHWLSEGYFHYAGMTNRNPDAAGLYLNTTGGYMVSGFIVEKLFSAVSGRYSYRLLAIHNQLVSVIFCALAGLLSYRLARRFGLIHRLSFAAGAAVVVVLFTFPDNLDLYWEMSAQAYALLFAFVYLLIEERAAGPNRTRAMLFAQAAAVFLMAIMELMVALGFTASLLIAHGLLRRDTWKRLMLVAVVPCVAAFVLYQLQVKVATARFPEVPRTGSRVLFRTGLDGDSTYYGNHLDIARKRDVARANWPRNREHLFRWTSVFVLGVVSVFALLIAFIRGRAAWIVVETLVTLTGAWLFYAAVFSQAIVIHPYLYDVLLFAPLCVALFALAPALLESLSGRAGAIILVIAFSAFWYSLFQLRLYALRWPLPPPTAASPVSKG